MFCSLFRHRYEEAIVEVWIPLAQRHASEEAGFEGVCE